MPGCVRPRVAVQQHHRLSVAAMPDAQRHLADVDIFEREAFEHELLRLAQDVRVRDEAGRASLDARSIRLAAPSGRRRRGHGHRAA